MNIIATTPEPPYYAVIFSSIRTDDDNDGYNEMAKIMLAQAKEQPGFLGIESARESLGITVSYWQDLESIKRWKNNLAHREAQNLGKKKWYSRFKTRISKVEREYGF